jgi:acetyltransferase-like isoleucine patch superfamily enzyme
MGVITIGRRIYRSFVPSKTPAERWFAEVSKRSGIQAVPQMLGPQIDPSQGITIGSNCLLERDISFWLSIDAGANPRIDIGDRVYIGRNSFIGSYQPITIGPTAMIGANSYIISGNHRFYRRDIPIADQGFAGGPVTIEKDAWIGTHATVLPGVTIGQGAIVGAGAVVTRSIPAYEIWTGVPARFLRNRP